MLIVLDTHGSVSRVSECVERKMPRIVLGKGRKNIPLKVNVTSRARKLEVKKTGFKLQSRVKTTENEKGDTPKKRKRAAQTDVEFPESGEKLGAENSNHRTIDSEGKHESNFVGKYIPSTDVKELSKSSRLNAKVGFKHARQKRRQTRNHSSGETALCSSNISYHSNSGQQNMLSTSETSAVAEASSENSSGKALVPSIVIKSVQGDSLLPFNDGSKLVSEKTVKSEPSEKREKIIKNARHQNHKKYKLKQETVSFTSSGEEITNIKYSYSSGQCVMVTRPSHPLKTSNLGEKHKAKGIEGEGDCQVDQRLTPKVARIAQNYKTTCMKSVDLSELHTSRKSNQTCLKSTRSNRIISLPARFITDLNNDTTQSKNDVSKTYDLISPLARPSLENYQRDLSCTKADLEQESKNSLHREKTGTSNNSYVIVVFIII